MNQKNSLKIRIKRYDVFFSIIEKNTNKQIVKLKPEDVEKFLTLDRNTRINLLNRVRNYFKKPIEELNKIKEKTYLNENITDNTLKIYHNNIIIREIYNIPEVYKIYLYNLLNDKVIIPDKNKTDCLEWVINKKKIFINKNEFERVNNILKFLTEMVIILGDRIQHKEEYRVKEIQKILISFVNEGLLILRFLKVINKPQYSVDFGKTFFLESLAFTF